MEIAFRCVIDPYFLLWAMGQEPSNLSNTHLIDIFSDFKLIAQAINVISLLT